MLFVAACGSSGTSSESNANQVPASSSPTIEASPEGNQTGTAAETNAETNTQNGNEETKMENQPHKEHEAKPSDAAQTDKPDEIAAEHAAKPSSTASTEETKGDGSGTMSGHKTSGHKDTSAKETSAKSGQAAASESPQDKVSVNKPTPTPTSTPTPTPTPKLKPVATPEASASSATAASSKPTETPNVKRASVTHVVEIVDFAFSIAELDIRVGDKVAFINRDKMKHTATADDKSFDTGLLGEGEKKVITFDKEGDFSYFCTPHPGMTGLIRVTAG
ncbi:cupredoxin family copper-binding protein [Paenibacillus sp. KS-LC4]|uniref:cupredoxin domain-containing protein n=1 Tax=Paenibacillus sp. KS-LC4 TaxID=2979727 RepID=UPI0030D20C6A